MKEENSQRQGIKWNKDIIKWNIDIIKWKHLIRFIYTRDGRFGSKVGQNCPK